MAVGQELEAEHDGGHHSVVSGVAEVGDRRLGHELVEPLTDTHTHTVEPTDQPSSDFPQLYAAEDPGGVVDNRDAP